MIGRSEQAELRAVPGATGGADRLRSRCLPSPSSADRATLAEPCLTDLQTIADAAKQLFPIEQPKEDLWDRIELAIKRERGSCFRLN